MLSPSAVAVMVTSPALSAVTLPFASTVAISVLEDDQTTLVLSAFAGVTVAVKVSVSPTLSAPVVLLRLIPVTDTGPISAISILSSVISQPVLPVSLVNASTISPSVVTVHSKLNAFSPSSCVKFMGEGKPLTAPVEPSLSDTPRFVALPAVVLLEVTALPLTFITLFFCNFILAYR